MLLYQNLHCQVPKSTSAKPAGDFGNLYILDS